MKVGSLVECVNNSNISIAKPLIKGEYYTVREILKYNSHIGVYLEEIINDINPECGVEQGYYMSRFREIQPPLDLTALLEESQFLTLKDIV